jgi:sulfane dehydrogenase subunit SoxC
MTKRSALDSLEPVAGNGLLHRRLFLTSGAAVAGLTFMTARAAPPDTPAWMKTPGMPMRGYGDRSAHEAQVQRLVNAQPGTTGSGGSRTPIE